MLALLGLPEAVQNQVEQGALTQSAAYEVSKLNDPQEQVVVAQAVVDQRLTRDEVGELVKAVKAKKRPAQSRPEPVAVDLGECTVTVRWKRAGELTATTALKRALDQIQAA